MELLPAFRTVTKVCASSISLWGIGKLSDFFSSFVSRVFVRPCVVRPADVGLEITELDREVSEKHGGAPPPDYEDQWSFEVALQVDLAILAQVEALEQRLLGASMQVKVRQG